MVPADCQGVGRSVIDGKCAVEFSFFPRLSVDGGKVGKECPVLDFEEPFEYVSFCAVAAGFREYFYNMAVCWQGFFENNGNGRLVGTIYLNNDWKGLSGNAMSGQDSYGIEFCSGSSLKEIKSNCQNKRSDCRGKNK